MSGCRLVAIHTAVKLNLNLSLTAKPAQRCVQMSNADTTLPKTLGPADSISTTRRDSPFALLAVRSQKPVRIPPPIISARPILRGSKAYLRALRAAEMAIWNENIKLSAFIALVFAMILI